MRAWARPGVAARPDHDVGVQRAVAHERAGDGDLPRLLEVEPLALVDRSERPVDVANQPDPAEDRALAQADCAARQAHALARFGFLEVGVGGIGHREVEGDRAAVGVGRHGRDRLDRGLQ